MKLIEHIKKVFRDPVQVNYDLYGKHKIDWHAKERKEREKQAQRHYEEARGRV